MNGVGIDQPVNLSITTGVATTYRVLATKTHADGTSVSTYLVTQPVVRVGADQTLPARILDWDTLEAIDPGAVEDGDARLADFGGEVRVQVDTPQAGMSYALLDDADGVGGALLSPEVDGDASASSLTLTLSAAAEQDIDLRVRVRRVADGDLVLLDQVLLLRVRADATRPVVLPAGTVAATGDRPRSGSPARKPTWSIGPSPATSSEATGPT